ncbi:CTP synthase [Caballeronia udeis]|uniref:CTP synthase (glutamine hydrolyzing) n=1 Tax=Caballeronia udeis TaxID=1232866 RepID=A0ABW8MPW0_9BURK
MLMVLEDDDDLPANYGALAAVLANVRHATLMHMEAVWDEQVFADAAQHVTADGLLVSSGLVWAQRLGVQTVSSPVTASALLDRAAREDVVVPLHPCNSGSVASAQGLIAEAKRRGVQHESYRVMRNAAGAHVVDAATLDPITASGAWTQDRFGRLRQAGRQGQSAQNRTTTHVRIALIGSEADHRGVNPATLAALGDAADAQDMDVDIIYIPPQSINVDNMTRLFAGIDGIVLPGGSDMSRVPGQVIAARYGFVSLVPVTGLCLGMQTMATAAAQIASGSDEVDLAEANPAASLHSFIRLTANDGSCVHRLGDQVVEIGKGSQLREILGERFTIRTNHHFRLNPRVLGLLNDAGVTVCATDASGHIADAIEARDHPFYIGMQGHPEVSSSADHPHPLLCAFLEAASRLRKR